MHRSADTHVSEQPAFLHHDPRSRDQYYQNFPYQHQHTALQITRADLICALRLWVRRLDLSLFDSGASKRIPQASMASAGFGIQLATVLAESLLGPAQVICRRRVPHAVVLSRRLLG